MNYKYLKFRLKHTESAGSEGFFVKVGLSDDKTSVNFYDYCNITSLYPEFTDFLLDISQIEGEKYIKASVTRAGSNSYVTISDIKLTNKK